MSAELISIDCEPPGEDIEVLLKDLHKQHAEGRLSSIAVALVYRDGSTGHAWSFIHSRSTLIGALERMKFKLCKEGE